MSDPDAPTTPPPLRVLIVDDEALARRFLLERLSAHPQVEVLGECANGFEAVKAVRELGPDLIFLDIQMPKLDGFEVLELLDPPRPAVIFVTAHDQYALQAFEVHAVDYLLKPFSAERLDEALTQVAGRALPAAIDDPAAPTPSELSAAARPANRTQDRIVVKDGTKVTVLVAADVDFVEAQDDYVEIHRGEQSWLKHQTLTSLAAALDPEQFVRIHRSTLLNLARLARIEPYSRDSKIAILSDGRELPISRSGHRRLKQILDED